MSEKQTLAQLPRQVQVGAVPTQVRLGLVPLQTHMVGAVIVVVQQIQITIFIFSLFLSFNSNFLNLFSDETFENNFEILQPQCQNISNESFILEYFSVLSDRSICHKVFQLSFCVKHIGVVLNFMYENTNRMLVLLLLPVAVVVSLVFAFPRIHPQAIFEHSPQQSPVLTLSLNQCSQHFIKHVSGPSLHRGGGETLRLVILGLLLVTCPFRVIVIHKLQQRDEGGVLHHSGLHLAPLGLCRQGARGHQSLQMSTKVSLENFQLALECRFRCLLFLAKLVLQSQHVVLEHVALVGILQGIQRRVQPSQDVVFHIRPNGIALHFTSRKEIIKNSHIIHFDYFL